MEQFSPGAVAPIVAVDNSIGRITWKRSINHKTENNRNVVAENGRSSSSFLCNMEKLRNCGWYWGPLTWEESELILKARALGSFLLRDSSDDRYIFSLSFKGLDGVHHARINQYKDSSLGCETIVELIEKIVKYCGDGSFNFFLHPVAGAFPAENILLLHPVSRFSRVFSLRHMCRYEILKHIRCDQVDKLSISDCMMAYLKQPQYFAEL